MKKTIVLFIMLFIMNKSHIFAQQLEACEKVVHLTYEALASKNSDQLLPHLSEDFSTAGYSGEIATKILNQVIQQVGGPVTNIKKIDEKKGENLILIYEAEMEKMGKQTSTFVFDQHNKLKEVELLEGINVKHKSGPTDIKENNKSNFSVPFKYAGKLILVKATINGKEGNFIIDNGAPAFILNGKHYNNNDANTKKISASNATGVGGSISNMDLYKVDNFNFAGIQINNQDILTIDISHLEEELKVRIDGLIGYEVYMNYDLLFDYKNQKITFLQPDETVGYLSENYSDKKQYETTIEMQSHIPTVKGYIGDVAYNFGIDCGAEGNLLDLKHANATSPYFKKLKSSKLMGANKNVAEVKSGNLKSLKIANLPFEKMQTQLSSMDQLNEGYDIHLDGLIGYEVLSKHVTLLSFVNKKLIFIK